MLIVVVQAPPTPTAEGRCQVPTLERGDRFSEAIGMLDERRVQRLRTVASDVAYHVLLPRRSADVDDEACTGDLVPAGRDCRLIEVLGFDDRMQVWMPAAERRVPLDLDERYATSNGRFPAWPLTEGAKAPQELVEQAGERRIVVRQRERQERDRRRFDLLSDASSDLRGPCVAARDAETVLARRRGDLEPLMVFGVSEHPCVRSAVVPVVEACLSDARASEAGTDKGAVGLPAGVTKDDVYRG